MLLFRTLAIQYSS